MGAYCSLAISCVMLFLGVRSYPRGNGKSVIFVCDDGGSGAGGCGGGMRGIRGGRVADRLRAEYEEDGGGGGAGLLGGNATDRADVSWAWVTDPTRKCIGFGGGRTGGSENLLPGRGGIIGSFGAVRSGGGGLLEGPASYPVSGRTVRPVKGLIYGSSSRSYAFCDVSELFAGG